MPETRVTEFPALYVDPRVGISRSTSETDVWLFSYLCHYNCYLLSAISFIFDILRRITGFIERHSVFFVVVQK